MDNNQEIDTSQDRYFDAVIIFDKIGIIVSINVSAEIIFEYKREEIVGKNINTLISKENKDKFNSFLNRINQNNEYDSKIEITARRKNGNLFQSYLSVSLIGERDLFLSVIRDITHFHKQIESGQQSNIRLEVLMSQAPLFIFEVDADYNFKYLNRIQANFELKDILGKCVFDFQSPDKIDMYKEFYYNVRKTKLSSTIEMEAEISPGVMGWYKLTLTPLFENEKFTGFLGISQDITETKSLEIETREAKNKAEEALKAKDRFLANMSHEVRTPMNAILGFSELALLKNKDEEINGHLNNIYDSGILLLNIIDDILEIVKSNTDKIVIKQEEVELKHILWSAINIVSKSALTKGLTLKSNFLENSNPTILADHVRVQQILINLLSNSIKYTKIGFVELNVSWKIESDNCFITFIVRDTGKGIKKENLENIFLPFVQGENSDGLGLGLAITKKLVEQMNGKINVKSPSGEFSTEFCVEIPFKLLADKNTNEFENPIQEKFTNKIGLNKNILLVEDEIININILSAMLVKLGYSFVVAETSKEAIEKFNDTIDVVLMDMHLPDDTGLNTALTLNKIRKLPIVAVTADAITDMKERWHNAGFEYFYTKPIGLKTLEKVLIEILSPTAN